MSKDLIERARVCCRVIPELELGEGQTSSMLRLQSADEDEDLIDWQATEDPEDDDRILDEAKAFIEMRTLLPALADLAEQQTTDLATANASILKLRAEVEEQRGRADK